MPSGPNPAGRIPKHAPDFLSSDGLAEGLVQFVYVLLCIYCETHFVLTPSMALKWGSSVTQAVEGTLAVAPIKASAIGTFLS
ncbi:MAG: hypothetical protein JRN37_05915 [Nitrososphaerota archaeon]|nr:hypothetical protein [Nitrososphaerota archaeon]